METNWTSTTSDKKSINWDISTNLSDIVEFKESTFSHFTYIFITN